MARPPLVYTGSGLGNVHLVGLASPPGAKMPSQDALHRLIALQLARKVSALQAEELRFLRKEIGLARAQLGALLGRLASTIGRWERGATPAADPAAEIVLRTLVLQHFGEPVPSMTEVARWCAAPPRVLRLRIDARSPPDYRLIEIS